MKKYSKSDVQTFEELNLAYRSSQAESQLAQTN